MDESLVQKYLLDLISLFSINHSVVCNLNSQRDFNGAY